MLFLLLFTHLATASTSCYRTNGQLGTVDIQPCFSDAGSGHYSPCCNLGKTPPDLCLAGGLCYRQDGTDGNFLIYAVGCTDLSGRDSACQQYCPVGTDTAMWSLNACFDGKWCCNDLTISETCCDPQTGAGNFTLNTILSLDPVPSATTIAGSTMTVTPTTTTASTVTVTASGNAETCSPGVLAGASVGSAIGGCLITLVVALLLLLRQKSGRHRPPGAQHQPSPGIGENAVSVSFNASKAELDNKQAKFSPTPPVGVAELRSTGPTRYEMDGRQMR